MWAKAYLCGQKLIYNVLCCAEQAYLFVCRLSPSPAMHLDEPRRRSVGCNSGKFTKIDGHGQDRHQSYVTRSDQEVLWLTVTVTVTVNFLKRAREMAKVQTG